MADFATDEGFFFASQATLAKKCRCSVEFVRLTVKKFVDEHVILVTNQGGGRGKATEFRFLRAVDNYEENPQMVWGFSEETPKSTGHKPPSPRDKPPSPQGYNGYNNKNYQQRCDFHNNPNPCGNCRSEQLAGMCITCHQSVCVC